MNYGPTLYREVEIMYVYADVIVALNSILNLIILYLTAKVAGGNFSWRRIIFCSIMSSIYVLGEFYPPLFFLYMLPAKIILSLIIVIGAFGYTSLRQLIQLLGFFYLVSFIIGGAVVGWMYLLPTADCYPATLVSSFHHLTCGDVLLGSLFGVGLVLLLAKGIIERRINRRMVMEILIEYKDKSTTAKALIDSGNRLFTIAGHRPVVIIELRAIERILSSQVVYYLHQTMVDDWIAGIENCHDPEWLERMEVIPYQSVGKQSIMVGFRPDSVRVKMQNDELLLDVILGIVKEKLSPDGQYLALLHSQIIDYFGNNEEAVVCALPGQS